MQLYCCWRSTNSRLNPCLSVCVFNINQGSSYALNYIHLLMSFSHIAFPCLSLHGMVWIVTLHSQCNCWDNSQACTAACSEQRLCFCLSKQTLSIFDVRFVWVSNNKDQGGGTGLVGHGTKKSSSTQIIHKMDKMLHIGPDGSGETSAEQRDNTDHISQRDTDCIFMRR